MNTVEGCRKLSELRRGLIEGRIGLREAIEASSEILSQALKDAAERSPFFVVVHQLRRVIEDQLVEKAAEEDLSDLVPLIFEAKIRIGLFWLLKEVETPLESVLSFSRAINLFLKERESKELKRDFIKARGESLSVRFQFFDAVEEAAEKEKVFRDLIDTLESSERAKIASSLILLRSLSDKREDFDRLLEILSEKSSLAVDVEVSHPEILNTLRLQKRERKSFQLKVVVESNRVVASEVDSGFYREEERELEKILSRDLLEILTSSEKSLLFGAKLVSLGLRVEDVFVGSLSQIRLDQAAKEVPIPWAAVAAAWSLLKGSRIEAESVEALLARLLRKESLSKKELLIVANELYFLAEKKAELRKKLLKVFSEIKKRTGSDLFSLLDPEKKKSLLNTVREARPRLRAVL